MGAEIEKSDWKLFQERVPQWQEAYMEKLEEGYIKLLEGFSDELREQVRFMQERWNA